MVRKSGEYMIWSCEIYLMCNVLTNYLHCSLCHYHTYWLLC